jgi:hypothetical protein
MMTIATTRSTPSSPTLVPATLELERQLRTLSLSGADAAGQEPGGDRQPSGVHRVLDAAGRRRVRPTP